MNEQLRRLIPQARTLITKESFRDQSFGSLAGYIQDIRRPIDLTPLVRVVHQAMSKYPRQSEASDGWLAPRVHASLRLFRSEAADQGIWDYLSVVVLRNYVLWRMAGEDGLVNDVDRIVGPFRHQAVARLWWAAELSRNGADYSPTVEAFSSQEAVNYLTNVDAFHNRPAALAYIRFISRTRGGKPIKQLAVETGKTLNHVLTTIVLDSFAPDSWGGMDALERWIAEAPDARLMDLALPQGPAEPHVPEAKIRVVEQLLERLMEEHRWHEVVAWGERWVAAAQSPALAATALPIVPTPHRSGSKDSVEKVAFAKDAVEQNGVVKDAAEQHGAVKEAVAKDAVVKEVVAKEAVLYERFVEALRDDLGVEPSDHTRKLFEKLSTESVLGGGTAAAHPEERGLSGEMVISQPKSEMIVDSIPPPAFAVLLEAGARGGSEPRSTSEPSLKGRAELSGMPGSIVSTAERVYQKLPPEQQTLARRIFLQLTELGEGSLELPRRVPTSELTLRPEEGQLVNAILKMLTDARLITLDEASLQIADHALIRDWKRLRDWLDEDRAGLRMHGPLVQAAQELETSPLDPREFYRGARLTQAANWVTIQEQDLANADETESPKRVFPGMSKDLVEREQAERQAQGSSESAAARRFAAAERRFIEAVAVYFGD